MDRIGDTVRVHRSGCATVTVVPPGRPALCWRRHSMFAAIRAPFSTRTQIRRKISQHKYLVTARLAAKAHRDTSPLNSGISCPALGGGHPNTGCGISRGVRAAHAWPRIALLLAYAQRQTSQRRGPLRTPTGPSRVAANRRCWSTSGSPEAGYLLCVRTGLSGVSVVCTAPRSVGLLVVVALLGGLSPLEQPVDLVGLRVPPLA